MYGSQVVGTCSLCGGRVLAPSVWMGVVPPIPQCESCSATPAAHGPIIEMRPAQQGRTFVSDRIVVGDTTDATSGTTPNIGWSSPGRWTPKP